MNAYNCVFARFAVEEQAQAYIAIYIHIAFLIPYAAVPHHLPHNILHIRNSERKVNLSLTQIFGLGW